MEIQSLRLRATDRDLEAVVAKFARAAEGVEDLKGHFTPDGVVVTGTYPTSFLRVSFSTTWALEAAGPEVHVRLAVLSVMGVPGGFLRGTLMRMAKEAVQGHAGMRVEGEAVIVSVPELAKAHGANVEVNFTAVKLADGEATVEAGPKG
jgi:hypothetical protein